MAQLFICGLGYGIVVKKIIVYGFLAISLLIATPLAAVFATTNSASDTVNGYTDNVQVSGTVNGGTVTGYSFLSTGSCTSGTNHCTATGYYVSIFTLEYYTISGTNHCKTSCLGFDTSASSSSSTSVQDSWAPGTGAASEAYNEGTAGYTTSGSYTAVTSLIDAGLPYN